MVEELESVCIDIIVGGTDCMCYRHGHFQNYNVATLGDCITQCCTLDGASELTFGRNTYDDPYNEIVRTCCCGHACGCTLL